jgi:hypothetical protein
MMAWAIYRNGKPALQRVHGPAGLEIGPMVYTRAAIAVALAKYGDTVERVEIVRRPIRKAKK